MFSSFEHVECVIKLENSHLRFISVYRPPPSRVNGLTVNAFFEEWSLFLEQHSILSGNTIITGDINLHLDKPSDADTMRFMNLTSTSGMIQHVKEATHKKGHILDIVLSVQSECVVQDVSVTDPALCDNNGLLAGDHFAVMFTIDASRPPLKTTEVAYRKLKNIDITAFKEDLVPVSAPSPQSGLNDLVCTYESLGEVVNKHAPLQHRTLTLRPHAPWYSEKLRELKHQKRKLERRWRHTRLEIHRQMFRAKCSEANKELLRAKRDYFSQKVEECGRDQKLVFGVARQLLHQGKSGLPTHTSGALLAESFASFFETKITKIRDALSSTDVCSGIFVDTDVLSSPVQDVTCFKPLDEDEVEKLVRNSPDKSCNLDPLPTWLLKCCLSELLPLIRAIVNQSLERTIVPPTLKKALVRPLLKKPSLDQELMKNYRPVSNLPFISKVIEKAVAAQLKDHLKRNNMYESVQSAYREFHSTETALLKVHNDILVAMDNNQSVVLIMLDLTAAFDTIDHVILLKRLEERYGVKGQALSWIQSYLSNRSWSVMVGDAVSQERGLGYGVPQGSILGPLLFVLYVAPLGDLIARHGHTNHGYADDRQLYCAFHQSTRAQVFSSLERCLFDVRVWMRMNWLKLNDEKTELVVFTSRRSVVEQQEVSMTIGDAEVRSSQTVKNLGVLEDPALSMTSHVNAVCKSSFYHLRNISRIRCYLSEEAAKILVHSLVISRLDYGNSLYNGTSKANMDKLQRVQNAAARLVMRCSRRSHISPTLNHLHWLPVQYRVTFKTLVQVNLCL